ncbi:MAG: TlpA family protein disulfide reductase [SAR324 cluster bacterium]|nr:TlpA family protein disulfide reductase [SAR324 cluster bacterium]
MKFNTLTSLFLLLGCLALFPGNAPSVELPTAAPSFRISNLEGKRFDSRNMAGQSVVLSFFYTGCAPCVREMPALYGFMKEQGALDRLLFVDSYVDGLGIADAPDTELKIRKFAERLKIPSANLYHDTIGTLARKIAGTGVFTEAEKLGVLLSFPTIVVINGQGQIVYVLEGSRESFLKEIQPLL